MCGICGYIGYNEAVEHLLYGLKMLLNRGYDSTGICTINEYHKFVLTKYAHTKTTTAIQLVEEHEAEHKNNTIGIGHSRWASTGKKTDENAHPHIDHTNRFAIVHNGIIENYSELKNELMTKHNVTFKSETDTEVITNLISHYYDQVKNIEEAIMMATKVMEGTWALCIISTEAPDTMFCIRHGSPLLVGFGKNHVMVASEQSGFCNYVDNYICLNDDDLVIFKKENNKVTFKKGGSYKIFDMTIKNLKLTPKPYPHWTIKEISEQYESAARAMNMGGRILNDDSVRLGGLETHKSELMNINHLILLGCGTSLHAGMYSAHFFKELCEFITVQVFDGGEFTLNDIPKSGNTGLIFISQSGETKDLQRCLQIAKDQKLLTIGVINVVDSWIAREVTCGVYLNAGKEMAVASTKAFTSQIIVLCMIAIWFAQNKKINLDKRKEYINSLQHVATDIYTILNNGTIKRLCKTVAEYLQSYESCFILGKGICESVAKEGALKMKEIAYIHTEGYSSVALKHGSFALIIPNFPIIIIINDDENYIRNNSTIDEIKAREAYVIAITDKQYKQDKLDVVINIPKNYAFRGILSNIPMQLIAYELALLKKNPIDTPKNLAKAVTVL